MKGSGYNFYLKTYQTETETIGEMRMKKYIVYCMQEQHVRLHGKKKEERLEDATLLTLSYIQQ